MTNTSKTAVADLVSRHIDMMAPRRNQREIAERIGFKRPNMLSMIRTGRAAVPFEKIPIIARELEIDPALLVRMHLKEVWPGFDNVVHEVFGGVLSSTERAWLKFFDEAGLATPPYEPAERNALAEMIKDGSRRKLA